FSSRRRHTRSYGDWSSDVCSSDLAAKFVRGDAIAALIITVINIVGGLAIGLMRHGMSFADAAATFTTLTAGDGLVSQIPALLVRSEERRVGKECSSRWGGGMLKEK